MPPRHAYWTIILEGKPTAFRTHTQEELLPTLRQLQARHPDAVMMWFARGRLWRSPDEARLAARARHSQERRGRDWRPGGEHRDPRERFEVPRDVKRKRFAAKLRRDRQQPPGRGGEERPPGGERPRPPARPGGERRFRPGGGPRDQQRGPGGWRPRDSRGASGKGGPSGQGGGRPGDTGGRGKSGGGRDRGHHGGGRPWPKGKGGGRGRGGGGRGGGGRGSGGGGAR